MKLSRFLKIKFFKVGMLNPSVDFQETEWLSRVLSVLEFSIFVKAVTGGLHGVVCNLASCVQTPAPAVCLDKN